MAFGTINMYSIPTTGKKQGKEAEKKKTGKGIEKRDYRIRKADGEK